MSGLAIREATLADLPAIVAMLADDALGAAREDVRLPLQQSYRDAFAAIDADPNQRLIVATLGGAVVGTMQLSFLPGLSYQGAWHGMIEAVRIAADLRGTGLGSELIRWAIDQCRARGCRLVQLSSNASRTAAHRFYARLGFTASHVGMKLSLDP